MKTTTVEFGSSHLKKLISAILTGKQNALELAFDNCDQVIHAQDRSNRVAIDVKTEQVDTAGVEDDDAARPRKRRVTTEFADDVILCD